MNANLSNYLTDLLKLSFVQNFKSFISKLRLVYALKS